MLKLMIKFLNYFLCAPGNDKALFLPNTNILELVFNEPLSGQQIVEGIRYSFFFICFL